MNYFRRIFRSSRIKSPLAILNIIGLSICMAGAFLILMYVWSELSYDAFNYDSDRIYRVESRLYEGDVLTDRWAVTTYGHGPAIDREISGIENYVRVTAQDSEQEVSYMDISFMEDSYCYADPSFFEIFNYPVIMGNPSGQLEHPGTAVLARSACSRYFGSDNPIGKVLTFKTSSSIQYFEVTGIMEDMPVCSHLHYDFILSYSTIPKEMQEIWYIHGVYTYVKLVPGKSPDDVEREFLAVSDKYRTAALEYKSWGVELVPLRDIHLSPEKAYENEQKGNIASVVILAIMALTLLLIGWSNALNFSIAGFLRRGREFGLLKAFGASRRQIFLQGIIEAGALNLCAAVLAFGWIELILPVVYGWTGRCFGDDILVLPYFWAAVAAVIFSGTLFTGIYPSYMMLDVKPSEIMRGKLLHSRRGNSIRKSLIVIQFIVSFVMLAGTFVIIQQVNYMRRETAKDDYSGILVIKYPSFTGNMSHRIESFTDRLEGHPGIESVSESSAVPGMEVANYFSNRPYGSEPSQAKLIQMFAVDYGYMSAYMPHLCCGRFFDRDYGGESNSVVLNEEAVKVLGYSSPESAVGQYIEMEVASEPLKIIGVVENYHQQSMSVSYRPIIFFLKELVPFIATPYISVVMDDDGSAPYVPEIKKIYMEYFPESLFSCFPLEDLHRHLYKSDSDFGWIFAMAALLAVVVSCLGLWVVALFSSLSRLKEVGIRKVLGASPSGLFAYLTRELMLLIVLASVIALPLSVFLMDCWLGTYAFHIYPAWWTYPSAFMILILIAFLTVFRQVWNTMRLKPIKILKCE